jgi:hypothetical protein
MDTKEHYQTPYQRAREMRRREGEVTVAEAAKALRRSYTWVYRLVYDERLIPSRRDGAFTFIMQQDVDRLAKLPRTPKGRRRGWVGLDGAV